METFTLEINGWCNNIIDYILRFDIAKVVGDYVEGLTTVVIWCSFGEMLKVCLGMAYVESVYPLMFFKVSAFKTTSI